MSSVKKYNLFIAPIVFGTGVLMGAWFLLVIGFLNWTIGVWYE